MLYLLAAMLLFELPRDVNKQRPLLEQLPRELLQQVKEFEAEYQLELIIDHKPIVVRTESGAIIQGASPSLQSLLLDLPVILKEWKLYPSSFIRKVGIKRVYLCHYLNVAFYGSYFGGLVARNKPDIFYSLAHDRKLSTEKLYSRILPIVVHHEIYHVIDNRLRTIYADLAWAGLHGSPVKYSRPFITSISLTHVTNLYPGFISQYSLTNMAEDKAEIFSRMMVNLHEMECRALDDPILNRKINYVKLALKELSPEINFRFWNLIRALERPRLAWEGYEDLWALQHKHLPPKLFDMESIACDAGEKKSRFIRNRLRLPRLFPSRNGHAYRDN